MAAGVKALRQIQWARETTPGTPVTTATALWRGRGGMLDDQREIVFPEEWIGLYGGGDRNYTRMVKGALEIAECEATFEQLQYLFVMLYGGPFAGTADGSGSTGFKYVTTIPTNATPTNTSYTVKGGDNFEVEIMEYSKCTKLTLKGSSAQPVTVQGSLIGRQVQRAAGGFTALSPVAVHEAQFTNSKLFLDPVAGPIGTTQITNQFLGFEITYEGMWVPKFTGDGNLYWTFVVFADKKITGKITLEHDTAASGSGGVKDNLRTSTPRLMRIDTLGPTYGTAGTSTTFGGRMGIRQDLPIRWLKVPPLDDIDGNDIITAEFESRYNETYASAGAVTICNETATLP